MERLALGCLFIGVFLVRGIASLCRCHGIDPFGDLLIGEAQRCPGFTEMPVEISGEHADEDRGLSPRSRSSDRWGEDLSRWPLGCESTALLPRGLYHIFRRLPPDSPESAPFEVILGDLRVR